MPEGFFYVSLAVELLDQSASELRNLDRDSASDLATARKTISQLDHISLKMRLSNLIKSGANSISGIRSQYTRRNTRPAIFSMQLT